MSDLANLDRRALERRIRALNQAVYLGEATALCRLLGRYKFYVDTRDVGFGAQVLLDGYWEIWLAQFLARRVKPGMHAVDVGANHGCHTVLLADLVGPLGRVAAFEPSPGVCALHFADDAGARGGYLEALTGCPGDFPLR